MPPGNQHIQTTFRRVLPADQLTRKLLLRGAGDVSHLLGLQREPQRCHAPLNAHAGLTASLCSANMNLPTALCCSGGCLPLSCFFSLSLLFDSPSRALSTQQQQRRGGGVRTHTHTYTNKHTLNATRRAATAAVALTVAYFPSSSYSWYSSVNLVEVTTVAMLTGVKGRGGKSPRASVAASRRFREEN